MRESVAKSAANSKAYVDVEILENQMMTDPRQINLGATSPNKLSNSMASPLPKNYAVSAAGSARGAAQSVAIVKKGADAVPTPDLETNSERQKPKPSNHRIEEVKSKSKAAQSRVQSNV